MWLKWRDGLDGQRIDRYLEKALEHLGTASSAPRASLDRELRAQIENVAAFVHTEWAIKGVTHESDRLEQAHKHIRQLEILLPENEWIGRFFDTRSYWYYAKAETLSSDPQEKKRLLEAALRDVEKALQAEEDIGTGPPVRREHQNLINKALSELGNETSPQTLQNL